MQYFNRGSSGYLVVGPLVTTNLIPKTGLTSDNSSFAFYYGSASGAWTADYSLTESGVGYYWIGICSNPIGSLGHLRVHMQGTGALPHWEDARIISTNIYNSFVTTADVLDVCLAYLGTTGASMSSGIMNESRDAFRSLNVYIGSSAAGVASGMMTSSRDAYYTAAKYWGGTGGPLSTNQISSGYIYVETDLVAGTTLSGPLTTVSDLNISAIGGTTINTTVGQIGVNVVRFANATFSTMSGYNIEGFFYAGNASATSDVNDITTAPTMTMSTSTPVTVGAFGPLGISAAGISSRAGDNLATFFDAGATATKTMQSMSTFTTANAVDIGMLKGGTFSTRSADNIEAFFYNVGSTVPKVVGSLTTMTSANLSTFSTATPVDVGRFAGASFSTRSGDNIEGLFYNAGATVTKIANSLTTMTSANLSTFTTALQVDIGRIAGATVSTAAAQFGVNVVEIASGPATAGTISTNTIYDVWTHGDLMKLMQSQMLGNTTYDGTTYVLYTHGGTTFVKFEVTTAERTRTT